MLNGMNTDERVESWSSKGLDGWMNRRPHERAGGRFLNSTEKYFRRKGPGFFFFFGHPFIWHSTVAHIFTTIGHFIELIYSEKRHMHITNCVFVK